MTKHIILKDKPIDIVENELKKDLGKLFLLLLNNQKDKPSPAELESLHDKVVKASIDSKDINKELDRAIHDKDIDTYKDMVG